MFVISCFDEPGALELRPKVRPAHLGYLEGKVAQIKAGGAFLDDRDQPRGSMLIVEAADRSATETVAADDTCHFEGVLERLEIRRRHAALGTPLG